MADDLTVAINALNNSIGNATAIGLAGSMNRDQQKRAIRYNWEMAKWQNATNIENWNMQNAYNHPSEQMKRLEEAGLNPNLVYDKGASTTASSLPAAPSPGPYPRVNYAQYAQMLQNNFLDQAMKVAGIKKTMQETSNLSSYQRNLNLEGDMKELKLVAQNYANAKSSEEAKIWKQYLQFKLDIMDSTDALNIKRVEDINSGLDYRNNVLTPLGKSNLDYIKSRKDLTDSEKLLIPYKMSVMSAQVTDLLSSAGLKQEQIRKVGQEITNLAGEWMLGQSRKYGIDQENAIRNILLRNGLDLKNSGIVGAIQKIVYMLTD